MAKKAMSAAQIMSIKHERIEFSEEFRLAFGAPESCGTWFVWGASGNGKSSFLMMLAKELSRTEKTLYNSLEEGASASFQDLLSRYSMADCGSNFQVVRETKEELIERLSKRRSPRVVFIDSWQYTGMKFGDFLAITSRFPRHLFIISSQATSTGRMIGKTAPQVHFHAMLKIYVEGYRAHSKGRFVGERGWINIWDEGAEKYWGDRVCEL